MKIADDYVLSDLLEELIHAFAPRLALSKNEPTPALAVEALRRFLSEQLGECAVCGAIGKHGKDYDQFTDSESLAHRVEADAQCR
jgi:hypothetical protein